MKRSLNLGVVGLMLACAGWLACGHAGTRPVRTGFRGYVRLGPDQEIFQPCGAARTDRWWLVGTMGTEGWPAAKAILDAQPRCDRDTLPCQLQEVYVELDGTLSQPGQFGHMGIYERELTATRFVSVARTAPGDCPQPGH